MFFLCFVVLALLPYQGFGQQCGKCSKDFTYYPETNKCYKVVATKQTWEEAFAACNKLGSHLVILESASDTDVLNKAIEQVKKSCIHDGMKMPAFWSAARQICPDGPFVWEPSNGTLGTLTYANWLPGEPNNVNGKEDCLHLLVTDNNALVYNDMFCDYPNCYICEMDLS